MFAVVQIGGNQYKVSPGTTINVDRLDGAEGSSVTFPAILVAVDDTVKLGKEAEAVAVSCKIVSHLQAEKIHAMRFRAKSRYRRHKGFRHQLTSLLVEKIGTEKPAKKTTTKAA